MSRIRCWVGVLLLLWGTVCAAGALSLPPLTIGSAPRQDLDGYLSLLDDPGGKLDLGAVRNAAADWRPAPAGAPSLGFRPGATWVRFHLENPGATQQLRWLLLDWLFVQSATLYVIDAGGLVRTLASGLTVPVSERPLASRQLLFPVVLNPAERVEAYLRIATRTATVVDLTLWQPAAYADAGSLSAALRYLMASFSVIVAVYSLLAWQSSRRPGLLALAPGQVCLILVAMGLDGFMEDFLPTGDGLWVPRAIYLLIFVALFCHAVFAREFFRVRDAFPRLDRLLSAGAWLCLAFPLTLLFGFSPSLFGYASIAVVVALSAVAFWLAWRGGWLERLYLLSWGLLWGIVLVRQVQLVGALPNTSYFNDLPLLALLFSGLVLAYALHLDIRRVRQERDQAFERLERQLRTGQEQLRAEVANSTRDLQEAVAAAEAANEAKGKFLSVMSHDLRTPLHTILGYTQLLFRRSSGEAREQLAAIADSSAQILALIDRLLDFSRGEAGSIVLEPEPVRLADFLAGLHKSSRMLAERRGNTFVMQMAPDLPVAIAVDAQRLLQILNNLLGNACKYTADGDIRLTVEREGREHLHFAVTDTGRGIAPEYLEQIFAPFARTPDSRHQPGVGLGLAIARQLARAMGGEVTVASTPGRGSCFSVVLPCSEVAPPAPERVPAGEVGNVLLPDGKYTLLVADDIPGNRALLGEMLRRMGFRILTAADGAQALAVCQAAEPAVDIALVDQFMPVLDGWGFLAGIRQMERYVRLPVFLISAAAVSRPPDFPAGLEFDEVLLKPLQLDTLSVLLLQYLGLAVPAAVAEAPPPAAGLVYPPADKLAEFADQLAQGKVLALQRWSEELLVSHPACAEFAARVRQLARTIDLRGLRRLLDEAGAGPGLSPDDGGRR